jgi:thermostable 8-oxoguanine DNA glycosylase
MIRFEGFTSVTMNNALFWDVAPCISCVNRRFERTYRLPENGGDMFLRNVGSHDLHAATSQKT